MRCLFSFSLPQSLFLFLRVLLGSVSSSSSISESYRLSQSQSPVERTSEQASESEGHSLPIPVTYPFHLLPVPFPFHLHFYVLSCYCTFHHTFHLYPPFNPSLFLNSPFPLYQTHFTHVILHRSLSTKPAISSILFLYCISISEDEFVEVNYLKISAVTIKYFQQSSPLLSHYPIFRFRTFSLLSLFIIARHLDFL